MSEMKIPNLSKLYASLGTCHPSLTRGMVWCTKCGRSERVDSAACFRAGWPKCCGGYTMTIDSPAEREARNTVMTGDTKVKAMHCPECGARMQRCNGGGWVCKEGHDIAGTFVYTDDEGNVAGPKRKPPRSRCEQLEKALEPFAKVLKGNWSHQADSLPISAGFGPTDLRLLLMLGDFRRAVAALATPPAGCAAPPQTIGDSETEIAPGGVSDSESVRGFGPLDRASEGTASATPPATAGEIAALKLELHQVDKRLETYTWGDRPPSPPADLLIRQRELQAVISASRAVGEVAPPATAGDLSATLDTGSNVMDVPLASATKAVGEAAQPAIQKLVDYHWWWFSDLIPPNRRVEAKEYFTELLIEAGKPNAGLNDALSDCLHTLEHGADGSEPEWVQGSIELARKALAAQPAAPRRFTPPMLVCNECGKANDGKVGDPCDLYTLSDCCGTLQPVSDTVGLRQALADLVALKDGPRDDVYRLQKDNAWERARAVLAAQPAATGFESLAKELRDMGLAVDFSNGGKMHVSNPAATATQENRPGAPGYKAHPAMLALESLTAGGSEFVGDIERCIAFVKDRQQQQHAIIVKQGKELNALRSAEDAGLREALLGLMPEGWDDGTMDHMPGIAAARAALAATIPPIMAGDAGLREALEKAARKSQFIGGIAKSCCENAYRILHEIRTALVTTLFTEENISEQNREYWTTKAEHIKQAVDFDRNVYNTAVKVHGADAALAATPETRGWKHETSSH